MMLDIDSKKGHQFIVKMLTIAKADLEATGIIIHEMTYNKNTHILKIEASKDAESPVFVYDGPLNLELSDKEVILMKLKKGDNNDKEEN